MIETTLSPSLVIKLASLVAHVQEMDILCSAIKIDFDTAKGLVDDPEVVEWMATIDPVLLPVRRS